MPCAWCPAEAAHQGCGKDMLTLSAHVPLAYDCIAVSHPPTHPPARITGKFSAVLADAVSCLQGGIELRRPDERMSAFEPRPGSYTAAAADPEASKAAEDCLTDWCKQVEELLVESNTAAAGEHTGAGQPWFLPEELCLVLRLLTHGPNGCFPPHPPTDGEHGPRTELKYWRSRMAKLNSLAEQLKSKEARVVLGTCQTMHSPASKRWKVRITVRLRASRPLSPVTRMEWFCVRHHGSDHLQDGRLTWVPHLCPPTYLRRLSCESLTPPTRPRTMCGTWPAWTPAFRCVGEEAYTSSACQGGCVPSRSQQQWWQAISK